MTDLDNLDQAKRDRLQQVANIFLGLHFDGSDDWWRYTVLDREEWAINIWDACVWGDGSEGEGMKITAYLCDEDGVNTSNWVQLRVDAFPLWVMKARLKVKEVL
jgi:hypothetical protein